MKRPLLASVSLALSLNLAPSLAALPLAVEGQALPSLAPMLIASIACGLSAPNDIPDTLTTDAGRNACLRRADRRAPSRRAARRRARESATRAPPVRTSSA